MDDEYTRELIKVLTDDSKWSQTELRGGYIKLSANIKREVDADSISGKIAYMFVQHQLMHSITKELIQTSNLYVRGEIWPTVFSPSFDNGKDKMTGWYLDYYKSHCIDCDGKSEFLESAERINSLRNKVAHTLLGKNESVIEASYSSFDEAFTKMTVAYERCQEHLYRKLTDLNKRVDFKEFI